MIVKQDGAKYEFGGVRFEETGEYRTPLKGEWMLWSSGVGISYAWTGPYGPDQKFTILRPCK